MVSAHITMNQPRHTRVPPPSLPTSLPTPLSRSSQSSSRGLLCQTADSLPTPLLRSSQSPGCGLLSDNRFPRLSTSHVLYVCFKLLSQITPPSFSPTVRHTDTEVSGGAEAFSREDISSQLPQRCQPAPVASSWPPTPPAPHSLPPPQALLLNLPPISPCPACQSALEHQVFSAPVVSKDVHEGYLALPAPLLAPLGNLRTQRHALSPPPASSSWSPGPSEGSCPL